MSLQTLPGELLYQIAENILHTAPNDIERLCSTCRRIRNALTPLLDEHRRLLQEYTRMNVDNASAVRAIFTFCKRPWVALYPRSLEVSANRHLRTLERPRTKKQIAVVEEVIKKRNLTQETDLEDLLQANGLISPHLIPSWTTAVYKADEDYLFALLLVSLPNLRRFVVRTDSHKMEQIKEMARLMQKNRTNPPRLKNVQVIERDGSCACDLELLPLLAILPGVEQVSASNLTGMYRTCYADNWLAYPGGSSSITHISLETCGMSVEGLEVLTKSLTRLKSFRYVHHRANWPLHSISSMLRSSHASLQTLELSTGGGQPIYIGSLRPFTALRNVSVDTDMLFRQRKMQRFVDIMPASIEVCTIAGNNMTKPLERVFLADLYRPSFYYPRLRSIWAEDSWGKRPMGKGILRFQREFHETVAGGGKGSGESGAWLEKYD